MSSLKWIASTRGCEGEAGDAGGARAPASASERRNARKRRLGTVVKTLSAEVPAAAGRRHHGEAVTMKPLRLAALLLLAGPGVAHGAVTPTLVARDLPVGAERSLAGVRAPAPF